MTRKVHRGFYADATPAPGSQAFELKDGESNVLRQYIAAFEGAREAIYVENQTFVQDDVFDAAEAALERGVRIIAMVPGKASNLVQMARRAPGGETLFGRLGALGEHPLFSLVGLAANRPDGHEDVYVHTKAAIVDDVWATIGSTNIANRSFFGDTELNASFWHADTVRKFRVELLSAHHGSSLSALSLREALDALAERAVENRARRDAGTPIDGHAFMLDAARWGEG